MDPVTMMVASIGMQFFNNYANNEKNDEIQAQQREFQIAAAEHDFERMRKAQAAAAKLALELEAEVHKERVEDIEKGYDTLLDNFANGFAITDWPLNVLPFIMKGESFGTLFGGTAKSISMHCILTPSNCAWFNEYFYDDLDFRVEAEMNNTWNAQSTHPVVYYGGGWNRRQNNLNGGTVPALIDLDDIALLKNKLKQIPTMVITPYFDPYLHFRVQLWGMGKDTNTPFRIDVPQGEVEPIVHRIFSYDYSKDDNPELSDDFFNTTMEEFVPYLTCLIGFVADKYFWSVYSIKPILPEIAQQQSMAKLIFKEKLLPIYKQTLNNGLLLKDSFIRAIDYLDGLSFAISSEERSQMFSDLYKSYVDVQGGREALGILDLKFLKTIHPRLDDQNMSAIVAKHIADILVDEEIRVWFCANKNELYQRIINESNKFIQVPTHFILEYRNDLYAIGCYVGNKFNEAECSEEGIAHYVVLLPNNGTNKRVAIDIESLNETEFVDGGLFNSIGLDEEQIRSIISINNSWLQCLCEMADSMPKKYMKQLEDAPIVNLTFSNLKDWIEENSIGSGEVNIIMGFIRGLGRYFYIISGNACSETRACYCNTIDDTMRDKFNGKSILTIKVN